MQGDTVTQARDSVPRNPCYTANRTAETITTQPTSGNASTLSKAYSYDGRNQLTAITDAAAGNTALSYDNQGNLTSKTQGSDITRYTYNARDNLIQVSKNATTLGNYSNDHLGLRIEKEAVDPLQPGAPPIKTRTLWEGRNAFQDSDTSGSVISRYETDGRRPVSMWNKDDGIQALHQDALGSIVATTDSAGKLKSETIYDAFGNVTETTGQSANKFGYTGHQMDKETGLIYFQARYYDPTIGRFITQDPFEGDWKTPLSLHHYLYAYANPTTYVDLYGYAASDVAKDAVLGVGDAAAASIGGLIHLTERVVKDIQAIRPNGRNISLGPLPSSEMKQEAQARAAAIEDLKQLPVDMAVGVIDGLQSPATAYQKFKEGDVRGGVKEAVGAAVIYGGIAGGLKAAGTKLRAPKNVAAKPGAVPGGEAGGAKPPTVESTPPVSESSTPKSALSTEKSNGVGADTASIPGKKSVPAESSPQVDKSWKDKIHGKAQKTGTPGHQFRTYREAIKFAKDANVESVHLDRGYNRALGLEPKTISPNRRPDVTSIGKNKEVERVEVQSKTDDPRILAGRNSALDPQLRAEGFDPQPPIVIKPSRAPSPPTP